MHALLTPTDEKPQMSHSNHQYSKKMLTVIELWSLVEL